MLVQEVNRAGYWLPAGRLDPNEHYVQAAIRECQEEAAVDIQLKGILDYTKKGLWERVVYYAEPLDCNQSPKHIPDYESIAAIYISYSHLFHQDHLINQNLTFRSYDGLEFIHQHHHQLLQIFPLHHP